MSETMGECERSVIVASDGPCHPYGERRAIAAGIDRLAADVAAVKAKVDAFAPEDVRHFVEAEKAWVALVTEQRDAAIRKRDEARAEVERLKESRDRLIHLCGKQQDEVDRLRKELEQRQTAGNSPKTSDSPPAAPQPAGVIDEQAAIDKDRAVVQRHCAAEQQADTPPAAPQPAAPAAWWLTDEERAEIKHLLLIQRHNTGWTTERHAELDALLARAGSPPVVEVPPMSKRDVPMQNEALAYRAAMDKAGVSWKEVPRE